MKTSDVLIVFATVVIPGALAVFFGVLAALDYARPSSFFDPMLGLLGSAVWSVVAVGAGLIATGMRMRKRASMPEP
jgi:hypothetical protein